MLAQHRHPVSAPDRRIDRNAERMLEEGRRFFRFETFDKSEEIGIDDFQADRSPDKSYRTAPLKGLWAHSKGGFYHDGRFPQLIDVVNHYNGFLQLGLTAQEKRDLVEYLKAL